jgi:acetoin utilization deacetylase AcuC-like enzyme
MLELDYRALDASASRMRLVYTENVHALPLPAGHRFPVAKYDALVRTLAREHPHRMLLGVPADRPELELAHSSAYVTAVFDAKLEPRAVRRLGFPWSEQLVLRSRRSVGGTLGALAWAMATGAAGHLAGGTHHAFRDRGEGFCTFNDIAVAIYVARRDYGVRRAAVIDLDVHQGNGTASIFAGDPDVFTLSLHGAHNYPFAKESSSLDVALDDGCDDSAYLRALDAALEQVPPADVLFYQAGVDSLAGDRLGRLSLTHAGLRARDARVFALARARAVPLIVTLGGGYGGDLAASIEAHANVYRALLRAFG